MSAHSSHAVTGGECALCDGPCRQPMQLAPVHANYPFMSAAHIAATQPPEPEPEPERPRARRNAQDRMRRPETRPVDREDRA